MPRWSVHVRCRQPFLCESKGGGQNETNQQKYRKAHPSGSSAEVDGDDKQTGADRPAFRFSETCEAGKLHSGSGTPRRFSRSSGARFEGKLYSEAGTAGGPSDSEAGAAADPGCTGTLFPAETKETFFFPPRLPDLYPALFADHCRRALCAVAADGRI